MLTALPPLFNLISRMQAGLVVGLMLIPQSMAYAAVAGLPAQHGLYTGFAPLILYSALGTSRQVDARTPFFLLFG